MPASGFYLGIGNTSHSTSSANTATFTNATFLNSGGVNLPANNIAVTAGSMLNLTVGGISTFGNLDMGSAGATLTLNGSATTAIQNLGAEGSSAAIGNAAGNGTSIALSGGTATVASGAAADRQPPIATGTSPPRCGLQGGGTLVLAASNTCSGATTRSTPARWSSPAARLSTGAGDVTLNGGTLTTAPAGTIGGNLWAGTGPTSWPPAASARSAP